MPVKTLSKTITDFSSWTLNNGILADGIIRPHYSRNLTFSTDGVNISNISELRYKFKKFFNPLKPRFSVELTWKTPSNYSTSTRYILFSMSIGYFGYNDTGANFFSFYKDTDNKLYIKGYRNNSVNFDYNITANLIANTSYTFVITFDYMNNSIGLSINGQNQTLTASTPWTSKVLGSDDYSKLSGLCFTIGHGTGNENVAGGYIKDVKITDIDKNLITFYAPLINNTDAYEPQGYKPLYLPEAKRVGYYGTGTPNIGDEPLFNNPYHVVRDSTGKYYVADNYNSRIVVLDNNLKYLNQITGLPSYIYLFLKENNTNGQLFVVYYHGVKCYKLSDLTEQGSIGSATPGTGWNQFNSPTGVWVDDNNRLYITEYSNHRLVAYDWNDTDKTFTPVWASYNNQVIQYPNPIGAGTGSDNNGYFYNPRTIQYCETDSRLYIFNFGGGARIKIHNLDGTYYGYIQNNSYSLLSTQFVSCIFDSSNRPFAVSFIDYILKRFASNLFNRIDKIFIKRYPFQYSHTLMLSARYSWVPNPSLYNNNLFLSLSMYDGNRDIGFWIIDLTENRYAQTSMSFYPPDFGCAKFVKFNKLVYDFDDDFNGGRIDKIEVSSDGGITWVEVNDGDLSGVSVDNQRLDLRITLNNLYMVNHVGNPRLLKLTIEAEGFVPDSPNMNGGFQ